MTDQQQALVVLWVIRSLIAIGSAAFFITVQFRLMAMQQTPQPHQRVDHQLIVLP